MTNDSKMDALTAAQQAIAGVEWGAGSEQYRYGRETMQTDAIRAVSDLKPEYPTARALTLDALRLIADARREMAKEIAEALEARASDTSYREAEAVTEHLLAAAGIARELGGAARNER